MFKANVFDKINAACGTDLDLFEDDIIPLEECEIALSVVESEGFGESQLARWIREAIKRKSWIDIYLEVQFFIPELTKQYDE